MTLGSDSPHPLTLSPVERRLVGQKADTIELLDRTTSSAKHMIGLIEGLLTYSRVGGGGSEMIPTDLEGVFQTVVQQMQDDIDNADAVVVSDPLPTVKGDKIQLVQLFQNLIENALKFRSKERPRVYMSVKPADVIGCFQYRTTASELIPSLPVFLKCSAGYDSKPIPVLVWAWSFAVRWLIATVDEFGWIVEGEWVNFRVHPAHDGWQQCGGSEFTRAAAGSDRRRATV